jgi:hypothetical protein
VLIVILMALVAAVEVEEPPPAPARGVCLVEPAAGLSGRVRVASGRHVDGTILSVNPTFTTVARANGDQVEVASERIGGLIPRACLERRLDHGALPEGTLSPTRLILADGSALLGRLVSQDAERTVIEVGGVSREVPTAEILESVPLSLRPRPIALVERHLEVPTARPPRAGDLHVALNGGTHLTATFGLLSWLSAGAGTILPVLWAKDLGANWQAGLRAGLPVGPWFRLAGGVQLGGGSGGTTGYLSATATWSVPGLDISAHAGPVARAFGPLVPFEQDLGLALAATWSPVPLVSVVAEAWTDPGFDQAFVAVASRWTWNRFAADAGLGVTSGGKAFPWFGLAARAWP